MFKLWILGAVIAILSTQFLIPTVTAASSMTEVINNDLRDRLSIYDKFLSQERNGPHEKDLLKLIKLTESALVNENIQEKQTAVEGLAKSFTEEFNEFIARKTEDFQISNDIQQTVEYYRSLAANQSKELKDEIETIIKKLQTIFELNDIKEKVEQYFSLEKSFSPEFQNLLRQQAVERLNRDLQRNEEFLEKVSKEGKFAEEIKAMIAQIQAARKDDVTGEEKQATLQKVTNPQSSELFDYLRKKFIEFN